MLENCSACTLFCRMSDTNLFDVDGEDIYCPNSETSEDDELEEEVIKQNLASCFYGKKSGKRRMEDQEHQERHQKRLKTSGSTCIMLFYIGPLSLYSSSETCIVW